jgi:hypothetical protein
VRHLSKALDLVGSLPEAPRRLEEELALHMTIAASLIATKGCSGPDVEISYRAARDLCGRLDRPADLFRRCAVAGFISLSRRGAAGPRSRRTTRPLGRRARAAANPHGICWTRHPWPLVLMKSADRVPIAPARTKRQRPRGLPIPSSTGSLSRLTTFELPLGKCKTASRAGSRLQGRSHVGLIALEHRPGDPHGLVGQRHRRQSCRLSPA